VHGCVMASPQVQHASGSRNSTAFYRWDGTAREGRCWGAPCSDETIGLGGVHVSAKGARRGRGRRRGLISVTYDAMVKPRRGVILEFHDREESLRWNWYAFEQAVIFYFPQNTVRLL